MSGDTAKTKSIDVILLAASEVFQRPVAASDNFLELDGNSLKAVHIAARVEQLLEREIDLSILFDVGSFAEFAELIDEDA
ncbi:phosphopantetheine-binding protein (plasmid) [Streptomyces viridifaciens]|nr:phosphopantetheine-binding protein [Streptomyces viridifaciens]